MIVQVSSGSTGGPVKIVPRSMADIVSIHGIVLRTWLELFPAAPHRVALLGGISHGQAASHLEIRGTQFRAFELGDKAALREFNPDFLACYPSIARELVADPQLHLPALRAMKLGGEKLFRSDLEKIQLRYPGLPVIEQFGSTEMPAVAMGIYRTPATPRRLKLQRHRFSFRLQDHGEWQPLWVRDDFPGTPSEEFFCTGDEVRVKDGQLSGVRRAHDPATPYHAEIESLLRRGCVNVQIDRARCELRYSGDIVLPATVNVGDLALTSSRTPPQRLARSNKLPFFAV